MEWTSQEAIVSQKKGNNLEVKLAYAELDSWLSWPINVQLVMSPHISDAMLAIRDPLTMDTKGEVIFPWCGVEIVQG